MSVSYQTIQREPPVIQPESYARGLCILREALESLSRQPPPGMRAEGHRFSFCNGGYVNFNQIRLSSDWVTVTLLVHHGVDKNGRPTTIHERVVFVETLSEFAMTYVDALAQPKRETSASAVLDRLAEKNTEASKIGYYRACRIPKPTEAQKRVEHGEVFHDRARGGDKRRMVQYLADFYSVNSGWHVNRGMETLRFCDHDGKPLNDGWFQDGLEGIEWNTVPSKPEIPKPPRLDPAVMSMLQAKIEETRAWIDVPSAFWGDPDRARNPLWPCDPPADFVPSRLVTLQHPESECYRDVKGSCERCGVLTSDFVCPREKLVRVMLTPEQERNVLAGAVFPSASLGDGSLHR